MEKIKLTNKKIITFVNKLCKHYEKISNTFFIGLIIGTLKAQEIKILDVKQKEIQSSSYLLITCE